ncbi:MAG: hypothetical protein ACOY94_18520 [Bacillota bacterium]
MNTMPEPVILTKAEYALIAGVLGASTLIGVDDPFKGLLANEIRAELDKTLAGLVERGIAEVRADRRVIFEQQTGLLAATCAFPEASFVLTRTHGDGTVDQRYLHITRLASAEMADSSEQDLALIRLDNPQAVFERVQDLLGLAGAETADLPGALLPRANLTRVIALAHESGEEAACSALVESGVELATAEVLARSLARPALNASFVALAQNGERWQSRGVALLLGDGRLWSLAPTERDGEEWVSVAPCTVEAVTGEIGRLMSEMLPFPVSLA